jgi:hypothetical protein
MSMGGNGGGFGRPQQAFQMPQSQGYAAPQRGMDPRLNYTGMSRDQTLASFGGQAAPQRGMPGGFGGSLQQQNRLQSAAQGGMPQTSGLHPHVPQMSRPFVQTPSQAPTQQTPTQGPMSPFGPIVPPPNLGGASTRPGMTGQQPNDTNHWYGPTGNPADWFGQSSTLPGNMMGGGGSNLGGNQSGMTGIQNPGAATGNPVGPQGGGARTMQQATEIGGLLGQPGGQSWDGLSQMDLSGPSGSMGLNLASLQGLGRNGLNISGLQMGNDMTAGRGGNLWVQDANGQRLGGVDQLTGKPLPFDLQNLDPNGKYSLNWSGAGPGGMRVMGRAR